MELQAALRRTEEMLAAAREALRLAAEEVESLEVEHRGLTLAVARHRGDSPPPMVGESEQATWLGMTRADAVEAMLTKEDRPIGPAELSRLLVAKGRRNDKPNYVAAALDYLKRRGRVESLGVGQWVPKTRVHPNGQRPTPDDLAED
ncbi:MAG: hypothetical protein ACRDVN_03470 [Jiangellaceae bacterium]